jgi:hypothetical protein
MQGLAEIPGGPFPAPASHRHRKKENPQRPLRLCGDIAPYPLVKSHSPAEEDSVTFPLNKTKIVATIGPASDSPEVLRQLILAGMNVVRLNFSHGDFSGHDAHR